MSQKLYHYSKLKPHYKEIEELKNLGYRQDDIRDYFDQAYSISVPISGISSVMVRMKKEGLINYDNKKRTNKLKKVRAIREDMEQRLIFVRLKNKQKFNKPNWLDRIFGPIEDELKKINTCIDRLEGI